MASIQTAAVDHPFWDEKLESQSLDDTRRFPFIEKKVLRARQNAVPERRIVYISKSSSSTGVSPASPFTADDFEDRMDYEARPFISSGLRLDDRYYHSLNFSLFVDGPCELGAPKLGAVSIHADTILPERLLAIARTDHNRTGENKLIVKIERAAVNAENNTELAHRFASHLKSATAVSAKIIILPPLTLHRATYKAKRVEDRRTGVWR